MLIDFSKLPETALPNFCGGELQLKARISNDGMNKILYGTLVPGASIGLHAHDTSSETLYVLSGAGKVIYDGEVLRVSPGLCHHCPKGHSHSLINDGGTDLVFFAVVPCQ